MGEEGNSTVQDTVIIHDNIYMDSRVLAWDLHLRHKDILKKVRKYTMDSIESCYKDAQGKKRTSYLVSRDGFVLMVTSIRNKSNECLRVLHRYDTAKSITCIDKEFTALRHDLNEAGVIRPWVNPRYQLDNLKSIYKDVTGDDTPRGFYDSIGNWIGVAIPYSSRINITVRDWILQNIPMKKIKEFILGVQSHTIVRSERGSWVHLGGFDSNTVEWDKTVKEFHGKCAYCGKEKPLLPEHLIPQTILSKEHPELVDRIQNIVPSCSDCNHSKLRHDWEEWYRAQDFYTDTRYSAIKRHINKYKL